MWKKAENLNFAFWIRWTNRRSWALAAEVPDYGNALRLSPFATDAQKETERVKPGNWCILWEMIEFYIESAVDSDIFFQNVSIFGQHGSRLLVDPLQVKHFPSILNILPGDVRHRLCRSRCKDRVSFSAPTRVQKVWYFTVFTCGHTNQVVSLLQRDNSPITLHRRFVIF